MKKECIRDDGMKMRILSALAVVAILLAAVLAPAMGALSLMNNSNESLNESGTTAPTPIPSPSPTLTPPILNLNLSENVKIIGNDSFRAHETPEFVIEMEQAFIDAVSDADSGKPVQVQIHVEGGEGSRLELFVEEIATNKYRVTIPNHKTEEFKPGIYTLVVEVGEQSVEHPFKWGLEPEAEPEEPSIPPLNLSEHLKIIGNDSFSANETPEFVIEIEQAFIDAIANISDGTTKHFDQTFLKFDVQVQIYVEGCESEGSRIELFVEEEETSPSSNVIRYLVTISNNKTGTEELTLGIYTLVVEVGEQAVEHPFEWGVEPEPTYVEPQLQNLTVNVTTKPVLTADKKHFAITEKATFSFEYTAEAEVKAETEETLISNISSLKSKPVPKLKQTKKWTSGTVNVSIETFVYDYEGELTDIEPEIEKVGEGEFNIEIPSQRAFRAGLYKLKVELVKDNETYVEEQDFTWGVLAINTHKSIYLPDETASIGMAVLDDEGHMVCDADVTLTIVDSYNKEIVLSTSNGLIKVSPECCVYGVTNLPDYYTNYTVSGVGTYVMTLTAVTPDGTKSITDEFTVQSSVDFDVARDGPTRIYPPVPYVMNFTITANKNYNGLIKEYVPVSFVITPQDGLTVSTVGDTKILSWNKNLVKGEVYNIYYEFDAPDISPYLFVLGALEIGNWQETRQWMIASDPAGTVNDDSVTASGDKNYNSNEQFTIAVVFHIGSEGGTRTADFNMQLRYGDNTTEGDDATTPLNTSCQDFKFVSVDTSDCDAKGYCTLTDNGDGTVRVEFTDDPTGNSVTITWTVEVCPSATTGSYDIDDYAPSTTTGTITLDDWDTVSVTQLIPPKTNETCVNTTAVGVNAIICVNHTVTKGTYDIDKTWVEITYPNGTSANITTSNTTAVCGAGGNVYGVEINVGSTTGNLTVNTSWVNDTHGNIDSDDPYPNISVSVKDLKAPQWSNATKNKTTIYENDYVKFTANWTDDVGLAGYKFSINQTGTWVNCSFVPFSGKSNVSENVTQITASAGTTVQWRFYANDTSNNWNVTDNQSFVVQSAEVITPVTPFMIYGRVFYEDGSECNNSLVVNITNLNNTKQWSAKTNASYNYYQLMLANGTDLNASEILQFNVSDGFRYNTTNYTVTPADINDGGLFNFNFTLPTPPSPSTPYMIYGWVFYKNGTGCNNPTVNITNMNNSKQWQAETNASYNFYQITLATGTDLNATEILQFRVKAPDASQFNTTSHTVTPAEIDKGGLFSYNITLEAPETPFMIYGWVNYSNGTPCNDPTVNITNTNTSITWQAETNASYNFYQLILDTTNVSEDNVLEFNATDGTEFNVTNHTVTQENITDGGLFDFNLTLPSPPTEGPTVDSITITPDDEPAKDGVQINPTPGGNTTVNISAVVSDPNGWDDVDTVVAVITGPGTVTDSPVNLTFVSNSTLMTATYNGTFNMSFYYSNGTYTVDVTATDKNSSTGSNSTTFNYTTAIALELDTNMINFSISGPIDPGETSEVLGDKNMSTLNNATVRNIGNVKIDVNVSGTNMTSDGNVITKDNIEARINETSYQNMSVTGFFDVNMTAGFSSMNNTDFRLYVPYGTPQGNYSGTITLTAVQS